MMIKKLISTTLITTCFFSLSFAADCSKDNVCAPAKAKRESKIIDVQTLKDNAAKHPKVEQTIVDFTYDFKLTCPPGFRVSKESQASYFNNKSWSYFDLKGPSHILNLQLAQTMSHVSGELRIGVNNSKVAYQQCLNLPKYAISQSLKKEKINDIEFTSFVARDKAMSKSYWVKSYRTQHNDACYAIELQVVAVDPAVVGLENNNYEKEMQERFEKLIHSINFQWIK